MKRYISSISIAVSSTLLPGLALAHPVVNAAEHKQAGINALFQHLTTSPDHMMQLLTVLLLVAFLFSANLPKPQRVRLNASRRRHQQKGFDPILALILTLQLLGLLIHLGLAAISRHPVIRVLHTRQPHPAPRSVPASSGAQPDSGAGHRRNRIAKIR